MILMSLLLVLSLERLISKEPNWHIEKYASQYREWLTGKGWIGKFSLNNNESVPINPFVPTQIKNDFRKIDQNWKVSSVQLHDEVTNIT